MFYFPWFSFAIFCVYIGLLIGERLREEPLLNGLWGDIAPLVGALIILISFVVEYTIWDKKDRDGREK